MSHYSVFVGTQANPEPRSSRVFQSIDDAIAEYNRAVVAPSVIYAELVRFSDTDANGVTLQSWGRDETQECGMSDERSAVMSLRILHNTLKATVANLMDKRSRRCAGEDKYLDGQLDAYAQCFSMVDACMMHLPEPPKGGSDE